MWVEAKVSKTGNSAGDGFGAPANTLKKGGRPKTGSTVLPVNSLEEQGINKTQSSRWQKEAHTS